MLSIAYQNTLGLRLRLIKVAMYVTVQKPVQLVSTGYKSPAKLLNCLSLRNVANNTKNFGT